MTNQIGIYDHETGEQIVREMTAEESAEREANALTYAEAKVKEEADKAAAEVAKSDLLAKLGITEDEAKLLLG